MTAEPRPREPSAFAEGGQTDRVVLATPPGRGAVASIILRGPTAAAKVDRIFRPHKSGRLSDRTPNDIVFGQFLDDQYSAAEEIVVCPRSAESIELHCHGGPVAAGRIVAALVRLGCEKASWEEWLRWEEPDAISAAARTALPRTATRRTAAILLDQYRGALRSEIEQLICLLESGARDEPLRRLDRLACFSEVGCHLVEPWRVVLTGPPNAGKSSLINAMLGYQRVIVLDQPGTTRDIVTASTAMDGWPITLADTPGLRPAEDPIEAAGVELATRQIAEADIVAIVFDSCQCWSPEQDRLIDRVAPDIVVHNKCDLPSADNRPTGLRTSATTHEGVLQLIDRITGGLASRFPPPQAPVPFISEQIEGIQQAVASLRANAPAAVAIRKLRRFAPPLARRDG